MPTYVTYMNSPLGSLRLVGDGVALLSVTMTEQRHAATDDADWQPDDSVFDEVRRQLDDYFAGRRRTFDLELAPSGTAFQKRVWNALAASGRRTRPAPSVWPTAAIPSPSSCRVIA